MAVARRSWMRGDVCLIMLDPTRGSEIRKTRPCLVVSPDELNQHLRTLIVAPMTAAKSIHGE
jgi:mRNA interferase MazF